MITSKNIEDLIKSNFETLRRFSVKSIALFGSYSRGEANEESDIDFLVTLETYSYRNFSGLRDYLESLTGKKIDLVCQNAVNSNFKKYIERDIKWLLN